jgi:hypothetical protein
LVPTGSVDAGVSAPDAGPSRVDAGR